MKKEKRVKKTKQNKTKQNKTKTKQNKNLKKKQNKTKQNKTKQKKPLGSNFPKQNIVVSGMKKMRILNFSDGFKIWKEKKNCFKHMQNRSVCLL